MSDLPYCGICGEQIVNAPAIGWYCPTVGCEGDWHQKANIVFDYKTDTIKLKEAEKEIAELKNDINCLEKENLKTVTKYNLDVAKQQSDIKELAEALGNASDTLAWFGKHDFALTYRNIANKHLGVNK